MIAVRSATDEEVAEHLRIPYCCHDETDARAHVEYLLRRDERLERIDAAETDAQRTTREITEDRLAEYADDDRERGYDDEGDDDEQDD